MLTIILTTFNRPQHLLRLLNYFCSYNVKHPICIGDASKPTHLERNKDIVSSVSRVLNVQHQIYDSSTDTYEATFRCLEQVETRYVVVAHDDDFVVPTTLDAIVDFMERNPSYESAQGRQISFRTGTNGAHSATIEIGPLAMVDFSVEAASAAERIRKRVSQKTRRPAPKTFFSVMRTATALRLYKEVLSLGLDFQNVEGLMDRMVLLAGNIKLLDRLYIAKQYDSSTSDYHGNQGRYASIITQSSTGKLYEPLVDKRGNEKVSHMSYAVDLVVDPLFQIKYERIVTCLANELSRQDGISVDESRKIINYWYWYFVGRDVVLGSYQYLKPGAVLQQNTTKAKSRFASKDLRQWARQIPGVRQAWLKLRLVSGCQMSPLAVLNPYSTFNTDLAPIYHAVTTFPPDERERPVGKRLEIADRRGVGDFFK